MSNTEIATVLGIRSGTVGALLSQGKNALRTILDEVVTP
jgi:DNA-directed RNA polymerase specialized sigma24 family protein